MRLLLDTQAFLWFVTDDPRLSVPGKAAIEEKSNERLLSLASVWEMAIKHNIGKLKFTEPFSQFIVNQCALNHIELIPISFDDVAAVSSLAMHHRDPFDRLLVAQASREQLVIVSSDETIDRYGVNRIW